MNIRLLSDNTVSVMYDDGRNETINSTHSHKALSALSKIIADLFPYKGAMEFDKSVGSMAFNSDSAVITVSDKTFNPSDDITAEPADVQAFCNAIWDNGGRTLWEAKQRIKELENGQT